MDLSLEALLLTGLFLLPGFFIFYTSRFTRPAAEPHLSDFELGLYSLGHGIVISIAEGLLFVLVIEISSLGQTVNLAEAIGNPRGLLAADPLRFLTSAFIWVVVAVPVSIAVGIFDPYTSILRRVNQRRMYSDTDIWDKLLKEERCRYGDMTNVGAAVHMKNHDCYVGRLLDYDLKKGEEEARSFVITRAHYYPGPEGNAQHLSGYLGDMSYVLIDTRNVDSVDFVFEPIQSPNRRRLRWPRLRNPE